MYNSGRLVVFVRVLGMGVEAAFLKECEAVFLRFPIHVVTKIYQGGRYGSERCCCKKDFNTTDFQRHTNVYNTRRMVAFVLVLGEGVERASLKECEAAFLRFSTYVVNTIWQRGCYGSKGCCCKKDFTTTYYKGPLGCTTPAEWWFLFGFWAKA